VKTLASERRLSRAILGVVVGSLAITVASSLTFFTEPALRSPEPEACQEALQRGFPAAVCQNVEMMNSAWGDSLEYFAMAAGRASYPPYALRPLYPKLVGTLARLTLRGDRDPMHVFERTSQVAGVLNVLLVGLLGILPLMHFRARLAELDAIVLGMAMLNMIQIGVLQTAPFFMLDIPTYAVFTIAASAFFSGQFIVLCITAAVGVLIKEVSIVLLLPMASLWWQSPERRLSRLPGLALPVAAFVGTRYLLGVDLLSVQYGWNISKGDIRPRYLVMHLGDVRSAIEFLIALASSIGAPSVVTYLVYHTVRAARAQFAVCAGVTALVILADLLLASRVPRVVAVCIPFMVFYSITAYLSRNKRHADA
jgi:hypothetical protein